MRTDSGDDATVLAALRAGDAATFAALVGGLHAVLHATAMSHVPSPAAADAVVRETWRTVVEGLDGFDGRTPLRMWVVRTAADIARARREGGPGSDPSGWPFAGAPPAGPAVPSVRFLPADHPSRPGHWAHPPVRWPAPGPAPRACATRAAIRAAIDCLPACERLVLTLRDVEGWEPDEAGAALRLGPAEQRALLHRARCRVRDALDRHIAEARMPGGTAASGAAPVTPRPAT